MKFRNRESTHVQTAHENIANESRDETCAPEKKTRAIWTCPRGSSENHARNRKGARRDKPRSCGNNRDIKDKRAGDKVKHRNRGKDHFIEDKHAEEQVDSATRRNTTDDKFAVQHVHESVFTFIAALKVPGRLRSHTVFPDQLLAQKERPPSTAHHPDVRDFFGEEQRRAMQRRQRHTHRAKSHEQIHRRKV